MSDVLDPNTDDGFAEAMRAKEAGQPIPPPVDGPPPVEEESPDPEPVAADAVGKEGEPAPDDDQPSLEERLAALEKQHEFDQEMIGRQAKELGDLRQQFEEEPEGDEPADYSATDDDWAKVEGLFDSHGGAGMMLNLSNSSPELIDAGLAFWKAQGDPEAFLFEQRMLRYEQQNLQDSQPQQEDSPADPTLEEIRVERAQQAAERKILAELGDEKIEALKPHVAEALEGAPKRVQQMIAEDIQSGDADRTYDAMKLLSSLAEPYANTDVSRVAAEQRAAASREAKKAATVATGSSGTTGGGETGEDVPSTREDFEALTPDERKAAAAKIMAKRILSQETSVSAGLSKTGSS